MKKCFIHLILIVLFPSAYSQKADILTFYEYLGYIKKYHPIVKQANLIISESEAKLLKARGLFDPKLQVDYNSKKFKNTDYFDKLNTTFKIPTWYSLELRGGFNQNLGKFLNPEANLPNDGLYNIGVSISLARDLLINERMAALKQAKLFKKQAKAGNQLIINKTLYKASKSYFQWLKTYQERKVYEAFLNNVKLRLKGVKRSYELGDKPAIDTTEVRIAYNNRKLGLEKIKLDYIKASLELSNFLWINDIPVEIKNNILPDTQIINYIDKALQIDSINLDSSLKNNPKIQLLDFKYKSLEVERRLKRNNLLPKIDLQYNLLSESPKRINTFNTSNYKAGVNVYFSLFIRKERAELKLTNYKLQSVYFDKQVAALSLKNNLNTVQKEISSYESQIRIANTIVSDYSILLKGEERKFEIGESSLFLINSRESKLIENKLKVINLINLLLKSKGKLFNVLGL